MSTLRIRSLGSFQAAVNNKIINNFETDKSRALLIYLATEFGKTFPRTHLAGLLWSDEPEERALHNLRQTLSRLRKVLGENIKNPQYILADRETIQLNPTVDIWVDSQVFLKRINHAYRFYQQYNGRGLVNIRSLKQALDLYEGPFLDHFHLSKNVLFEEWASLIRENLNQQAIKAWSLLAEYHERRGEYHLALQAAQQIVQLAPWDETSHGQVIRLLGVDQQWSAAQNQYVRLCNYLSDQFGITPSAEMVSLFNQIRTAAAQNLKIPPRFPLDKHNLADTSNSFIGRACEVDQVIEMIVNPTTRLVSILGPGGIGKTRFAQELAYQSIGIFRDGVYYVSLVAAQNPNQITQYIAEALGIIVSEKSDPQKQLIDHLRNKEMLLVLDNFEHLLVHQESTLVIDKFLNQTTRVTLLITSRERLNLQQECSYTLHGLNYPKDTCGSMENILTFDAINLFTKRAGQIQQNFELSNTILPKAIRICQILDGLPLGIELAASAIFEQDAQVVLDQIEHNLDLLTSSMNNVEPRHRNLRAAFEVSWELLSTDEKILLSKLSVFRGGFDRQAAQQITDISPEILSALVFKSLIKQDGNQRFYLHETIRQFVAEELALSGSQFEIQNKHAFYYVSFISNLNFNLRSGQQPVALTKMQQEFGNLSWMWQWLVQNKHSGEIAACAESLYHFFSVRSLFKEGMLWFQEAIQTLKTEPKNENTIATLLLYLGSLAYLARENTTALTALQDCELKLRTLNDFKGLSFCELQLGWVYYRQKEFSRAETYASQSLLYFQRMKDDLGQAQALSLLGSIQQKQGYNREAKGFFEAGLLFCRKTENQQQLSLILNRLGDLACYDGQYQIAVNQFKECLTISQNLNDRYNQAIMLNNLGTIYHVWEDYPNAKENYQKSMEICQDIGDQDGIALALNNLGELATLQGEFETALQYSQKALEIAEQLNENWTIIVCLNSLGEIYSALGHHEQSKQYYLKAIRMAVEINGMDLVARVSVNLGRVYQLLGQPARSIALFKAAAGHSATEHDLREKAIHWLKEIDPHEKIKQDDQLLLKLITELLDEEVAKDK